MDCMVCWSIGWVGFADWWVAWVVGLVWVGFLKYRKLGCLYLGSFLTGRSGLATLPSVGAIP